MSVTYNNCIIVAKEAQIFKMNQTDAKKLVLKSIDCVYYDAHLCMCKKSGSFSMCHLKCFAPIHSLKVKKMAPSCVAIVLVS